MSQITKDINKITGTIIGVSGKLILYAVAILLLAEGISRGYAFGHSLFYESAMEEPPGTDKTVTIPQGQKQSDTIRNLKDAGLIDNELAMQIQIKFYDYEIHPGTYILNTSMSAKEILQMLNENPESEDSKSGSVGAAGTDAQEAAAQPQVQNWEGQEDQENYENAEDGETAGNVR